MSNTVIEQFEIPVTEWKTVDAGQGKIRIKGVALRGDAVSKNNRHYIAKELKKATNTWIGKPININHNDHRIVGHLTFMEYDEDADLLLYEGEVNKQPYVDLLRTRSSEIRGVSIQAGYLYNKCYKCGARFYTEEDFRAHMNKEHYIKINPKSEPHGIVGEALSLVLSPEIPGYDGTSIDLAEIARQRTLQLLEIVINNEKERETYMSNKLKAPVAISSPPTLHVGAVKEISEDEHNCGEDEHWSEEKQACVANSVSEQEHTCPDGEHWSETEGKCVKDAIEEQEDQSCPAGSHWSESEGKCVEDAVETQEEQSCPVGTHWDKEKMECVPDEAVVEQAEHACPDGEHWDEAANACVADIAEQSCPEGEQWSEAEGKCVKVTVETYTPKIAEVKNALPTKLTLKESKLDKLAETTPVKLSLGEPFAGYSDFAACVAANQDKENPEAYCGQIKHEVEGEMFTRKKLGELTVKVNELVDDANKPVSTEIKQDYSAVQALREQVLSELQRVKTFIPRDDLGWKRIKPYNDAGLKETIRQTSMQLNTVAADLANRIHKIKPYNDAPLKEAIGKIKPYDDAPLKEAIGKIKPYDDTELRKTLEKLPDLETRITALSETVKTQEQKITEYQKTITEKDALIEKVAGERNKLVEDQGRKIEDLTSKVAETVADKQKLTEDLGKRLENIEDKLPSVFKGRSPPLRQQTDNDPITSAPSLEKEAQ